MSPRDPRGTAAQDTAEPTAVPPAAPATGSSATGPSASGSTPPRPTGSGPSSSATEVIPTVRGRRHRSPKLLAGVALAATGVVAVALGITASTAWTVDDVLTSTAVLADGTPLVVTAEGVPEMRPGPVVVEATGAGDIALVVGRADDVTAWIGEDAAAVVTGEDPGTGALTVDPAAATSAAVTEGQAAPTPAGGDLWVQEVVGSGTAVLDYAPPEGSYRVLAGSSEGGVTALSMTWPVRVAHSWALPVMIAGGVLLLAGLLLMALVRRGASGPRVPRRRPDGAAPGAGAAPEREVPEGAAPSTTAGDAAGATAPPAAVPGTAPASPTAPTTPPAAAAPPAPAAPTAPPAPAAPTAVPAPAAPAPTPVGAPAPVVPAAPATSRTPTAPTPTSRTPASPRSTPPSGAGSPSGGRRRSRLRRRLGDLAGHIPVPARRRPRQSASPPSASAPSSSAPTGTTTGAVTDSAPTAPPAGERDGRGSGTATATAAPRPPRAPSAFGAPRALGALRARTAPRFLALGALPALGLAGCGAGDVVPQPQQAVAASPALTEDQLTRIVDGDSGVTAVVDAADAARDATALAARVDGPLLQVRQASYAAQSAALAADPAAQLTAPLDLGGERLVEAVPTAGDWPRQVMTVDRVDAGTAPVLEVLTQADPRSPYKATAAATLLPGATFPALVTEGGAVEAVPTAAGEDAGLTTAPVDALAHYADVLQLGPGSAFTGEFAEDPFTTRVLADQDTYAAGLARYFTSTVSHSPREGLVWAVRTEDGGAVVVGVLDATSTFETSTPGVVITQPADVAALGGAAQASAGTVVTAETVVLRIPAEGSTDQISVIGAQRGYVSATLTAPAAP